MSLHRLLAFVVLLAALVALTFAADPADAGCPVVRARQLVQQRAVIVAPTVITTTAFVPTYTSTYDSGYAALLQEVKGLRQDLRAALAPGAGQAPASNDLTQVMVQACAKCHQGDAKAEKSGGGQVLLEDDGSISVLSPGELKAILTDVRTGAMPPGGVPLSEAQKKLFDQLPQMNAAARAKAAKAQEKSP